MVLVKGLLKAVAVELGAHAEGVLAVSLGEVAAPLINVSHYGGAGAFFRRGVSTAESAVRKANSVEVALPRTERIAAGKALIVTTSLNQLLREALRKQNRIYRISVVSPEME